MKKLFFPLLMICAIALTACSSASTNTPPTASSSSLPVETQLAAGTLKLAGTDQDISVEQAKQLIVYWQVYRDLSQSETAAQAEIDGLIEQIEETMTADQRQAISAMNITQQDVLTSMKGVTVDSNSSSNSTVSLPSGSSNGGGMPAGGPPADGGGAPPDGGMPAAIDGAASAASNTDQSQGAQVAPSVSTQVPSALVEAVIQSLQQKIAA